MAEWSQKEIFNMDYTFCSSRFLAEIVRIMKSYQSINFLIFPPFMFFRFKVLQ